jgi:hypothetical protein
MNMQTTPVLSKLLEEAAQRMVDTFIKAVREHPLPSTEEIEGWIEEARAKKEVGQ